MNFKKKLQSYGPFFKEEYHSCICNFCDTVKITLRICEYKLKDKDYCPIEIIKGLTDKGQFQYLTKLMGPQEGTYLYATQFHSLR